MSARCIHFSCNKAGSGGLAKAGQLRLLSVWAAEARSEQVVARESWNIAQANPRSYTLQRGVINLKDITIVCKKQNLSKPFTVTTSDRIEQEVFEARGDINMIFSAMIYFAKSW